MLKKLNRYYHTLKHLKPIQIRYQVWYRVRDRFFPVEVPDGLKAPEFQEVKLKPFPKQFEHYLEDGHFSLLHQEHTFNESINWNYSGYGKLWTYHLNYFDYLHQPGMRWETGKELMDDFLADIQNRMDGMEPYPISLRTINWIKFLAVHQRFPQHIVESLHVQYLVLTKKPEYHLLGNHLLENGFSLLFGAVFFQDEKLTQLAKKILSRELNEQILEDGAHFELSPMYHTILLQRALDGYNLLINNNHDLKEMQNLLEQKIQLMVNWLDTMQFRNGDIPMFNDSTHGQALDPKTILDYAKRLGFSPEPIKLTESGYRKFESGDFEMEADVGSVGPSYQPGHAHCDMLSFVLYHKGKPVIVDREISTYEKNSRREEERGTASHNTVMINGEEQSDVWGGFRVGRRAIPEILEDLEGVLSATHTGYEHIGCKHRRKWTIEDGSLQIEDLVDGDVKRAEAWFHFHPEVVVRELDRGTFHIENLILALDGFRSAEIESYEYCLGFNKKTEALRLRVVFGDRLKTVISKG
ncbi:hypothetical protein CWD77_04065 [Rhodohalobacter barkolensis]|uniref:Uncharacterized protein n=2 Tax=Rhodohalobacter barkolensis TaxID=2053187 RepID=A0A2N0VKD1_9BACT|nr:hypothetical protein CWD77_04065 [Rhodohalobacter barkolensis]